MMATPEAGRAACRASDAAVTGTATPPSRHWHWHCDVTGTVTPPAATGTVTPAAATGTVTPPAPATGTVPLAL